MKIQELLYSDLSNYGISQLSKVLGTDYKRAEYYVKRYDEDNNAFSDNYPRIAKLFAFLQGESENDDGLLFFKYNLRFFLIQQYLGNIEDIAVMNNEIERLSEDLSKFISVLFPYENNQKLLIAIQKEIKQNSANQGSERLPEVSFASAVTNTLRQSKYGKSGKIQIFELGNREKRKYVAFATKEAIELISKASKGRVIWQRVSVPLFWTITVGERWATQGALCELWFYEKPTLVAQMESELGKTSFKDSVYSTQNYVRCYSMTLPTNLEEARLRLIEFVEKGELERIEEMVMKLY